MNYSTSVSEGNDICITMQLTSAVVPQQPGPPHPQATGDDCNTRSIPKQYQNYVKGYRGYSFF